MTIDVRPIPAERLRELLVPIGTVFGIPMIPERVERARAVPELEVLLGACEGDVIVGSTGAFTFDMTVPGGVAVETSGLTLVAVLPTHRRRGILRQMMRRHLDEAHRRGQAVAALFASEGSIYGRFGYGLAALRGEIDLPRHRSAFAQSAALSGRVRLVPEAEAAVTFPLVWEHARLSRPGMLSRSDPWWRARRLADPDWLRGGRPPLQRALLEIDGRPRAYAIYRFDATFGHREHDVGVELVEVIADGPETTRAIWRYLFDLDLVTRFLATELPVDHPLLFLLAEPRQLRMRLSEGLCVRLVDVGAALSRRGYAPSPADEPLVLEVTDAFCPWNAGRYRLAGGVAERTSAEPDLALDVEALGAAYLGGFSLTQLAQAGRVVERRPGALCRADVLFRGEQAPWCPEIF